MKLFSEAAVGDAMERLAGWPLAVELRHPSWLVEERRPRLHYVRLRDEEERNAYRWALEEMG